ncbi:MAG: murein DD-endopeptidase MepM/ murein hydrolase activator NlpD [Cellvibrionaceae bacterium]|jgi:murein DD-endopeptidase MepM/ murein hydrolase activator NlpD
MYRVLAGFTCGLILLIHPLIALAQTDPPEPIDPAPTTTPIEFIPRYHTVDEGETLYFIAAFYAVSEDALQIANEIIDPTLLFVGQQLLIPAADGQIVPATYAIKLGDSSELIAEKFGAVSSEIIRENHLLSPDSLIPGLPLKVFSRTGSEAPAETLGQAHIVQTGETMAHIASGYGLTVSSIKRANNLVDPFYLYQGQRLRIPTLLSTGYTSLPGLWKEIRFDNIPIKQGDTVALYVEYLEPGTPRGRIVSASGEFIPLRFIPTGGGFTTLIGFDAFATPGMWELVIDGEGAARPWDTFSTEFLVADSGFGTQFITLSSEFNDLLAPELRAAEDAFLETIFTESNPEPYWTDVFRIPVTSTVSAGYGDGRSYNDGPVTVFHSGIDFEGTIGTPIYSPAEGKIVFVGPLELRGNAIIIDHGMGVMTAYYHLASFDVELGDVVEARQKIADGGNTGLSTGPHLHWDLRVWGKAVHPTRWLERLFP